MASSHVAQRRLYGRGEYARKVAAQGRLQANHIAHPLLACSSVGSGSPGTSDKGTPGTSPAGPDDGNVQTERNGPMQAAVHFSVHVPVHDPAPGLVELDHPGTYPNARSESERFQGSKASANTGESGNESLAQSAGHSSGSQEWQELSLDQRYSEQVETPIRMLTRIS